MCQHDPNCQIHDNNGNLTPEGELYVEALKIGYSKGMIKVVVDIEGGGTESMWAWPIGQHHAQIDNIPFHCDIGFGDIVKLGEPEEEDANRFPYVSTVIKNSHTYRGSYLSPRDKKTWQVISKHFSDSGLRTESMLPGYFVIATIAKLHDADFVSKVVKSCPVECSFW
jgi:hypothetical protein